VTSIPANAACQEKGILFYQRSATGWLGWAGLAAKLAGWLLSLPLSILLHSFHLGNSVGGQGEILHYLEMQNIVCIFTVQKKPMQENAKESSVQEIPVHQQIKSRIKKSGISQTALITNLQLNISKCYFGEMLSGTRPFRSDIYEKVKNHLDKLDKLM
jgi:hypothetical protein